MTPSEHRLHPVAIVLELGGQVRQLAFAGLAAFFTVRSSGAATEIAGVIAVVPILLASISKVLTFRYSLEGGELAMRWGILFRTERHIPFSRIQNLDASESLVHRVTGTVAVAIETGTAGEVEAKMPALPREAFDAMRQRVFARSGGGDEEAREVGSPAPEEGDLLVALRTRDLVVAGLLHGHGWLIVGAGLALIYQFDPVGEWFGGRVRGVLDASQAQGLFPSTVPKAIALVLGLLLVFGILMRLFSVLVAVVRYHGHEVRLVDGDLRTSQGLLTRVRTSTPLRRIQTVTIRTGPLHRWFGRVRVMVTTAGGSAADAFARAALAPVLDANDVEPLVQRLLPGVVYPPAVWERAHPRARWRAVRRGMILGVPFVLVGWPLGMIGVTIGVVGMLCFVLIAVGRVQRFAFHAEREVLVLADGWLWQRVVVVRPDRMQVVSRTQSPFDRRAGMARLHVDTAGSSHDTVSLPHLGADRAETLAALYYSAAAGTAFRS